MKTLKPIFLLHVLHFRFSTDLGTARSRATRFSFLKKMCIVKPHCVRSEKTSKIWEKKLDPLKILQR